MDKLKRYVKISVLRPKITLKQFKFEAIEKVVSTRGYGQSYVYIEYYVHTTQLNPKKMAFKITKMDQIYSVNSYDAIQSKLVPGL